MSDVNYDDLPDFGSELTADFETLTTRASDLLDAYHDLLARYRSLERSHQVAIEEAQRLATELDATREEHRRLDNKLRRERNDAQTDLAMMKGDVTAVASTLVNSINGMRRRAAERAKAREPLQGAPQRSAVVRDLDDPSHLRMFHRA